MKLLLIVIVVSYLAVPASAVIDEEDMLGIWTFDEGSGKEVRDFSGNENDGEIFGQAEWVEGKFGKAIEFAGGYVQVEHKDDMNLEAFSLTAWINVPKIVDPYQFIIGKENWPDRNYSMWVRPGTVVVGFTNGGDKQVAGASVVDGTWHHVAGTYDGQILRIYVDGVQNGQISPASTPNTCSSPLMIGTQPPAGGGPMQGIIDDVGVFKAALAEEDIKRVMENGLKSLALAVEPDRKLCTVWGALRNAY